MDYQSVNVSPFDLSRKVIVVTGGAGLLGNQYVQALSEAGAHVIVADIDPSAAENVALSVKGATAIAIQTDVTQPDSVHGMVAAALREFGRIDGLVNNAAIDPKFDKSGAGSHVDTFETLPLALWNQSLSVNLTGMMLCTQAIGAVMLEQRSGVVVNISSIYGLVGPDQRLYESDRPGSVASYKPITYSVTKSAVIGFTKYLATYWAGKGIRVNTLTLGGVYNDHPDEFVSRYSARVPIGRMAMKNEYCGALIYLLSEASSYMTGSNLVVDGGWTAW